MTMSQPDTPYLYYYSPLLTYLVTPLKKEMFLEQRKRGDTLPEKEWDTLALVSDEQYLDKEIDLADVINEVEEGARKHGSRLCAAVLGAYYLGHSFWRKHSVDGLSWLARAVHEGVHSAAYPLAEWYANRASQRDLQGFVEYDAPFTSRYDPTPDCPPVPFPKNRAECLDRTVFWALTGLSEQIYECEEALDKIGLSDDLVAPHYDLLRKAAQTDSVMAKGVLATYLFRDGTSAEEHAEAIGLLRAIAGHGVPREIYLLSMFLKDTVGELPDSTSEEAFQLCLKAAEGGYPAAMRELSFLYEDGFGTEKNHQLSVKWLADGAEAGDGECRLLVGKMLLSVANTPKERREAVNWIRMAAEENDDPVAWAILAEHFETGDGLYKSKKQAHYCRKRAEALGWQNGALDRSSE